MQASDEAAKMTKLVEGCKLKEGILEMPQDSRGMQGCSWNLIRYKAKTKFNGNYTVGSDTCST